MSETLELKAKLDDAIEDHQVLIRTFTDMICAVFDCGESSREEKLNYPDTIRDTINIYLAQLKHNIDVLFQ